MGCLAMVVLRWGGMAAPAETVSYPSRTLQLIVPWAAGGGSDRVGRFVADGLQKRLGKPVIVVNRTGGGGAVGHGAGAMALPDGHTLTLATFELSTMRSLGISKVGWEDFAPVALLNTDAASILVRKDAPWRSLGEFLDAVRKSPGKVKMSGTATGGAWDLARAGLLLSAGIPVTNVVWVPTQGSAPALVELLGGHIDSVACSVAEASSQVASGDVRVLAVLGTERLAEFPDLPTAREQGVNYEAVIWRGLLAPKGTPEPVIARLASAAAEIGASTEYREFMRKNGFGVTVAGPEAFAGRLRAEESKWQEVIRSAGFESIGRNRDPGPYAVPMAMALLVVAATLVELFRGRRPPAVSPEAGTTDGRPAVNRTVLVLVAMLLLYVGVLSWVGFAVSTFLFAAAAMLVLKVRTWMAWVGAGALVGGIHLLFVVLFKVPLP